MHSTGAFDSVYPGSDAIYFLEEIGIGVGVAAIVAEESQTRERNNK